MKIPNAEGAVIAPEKLRDYLLNPSHRRGGSKARLLVSLGYEGNEWERLESDLRAALDCGIHRGIGYDVRQVLCHRGSASRSQRQLRHVPNRLAD